MALWFIQIKISSTICVIVGTYRYRAENIKITVGEKVTRFWPICYDNVVTRAVQVPTVFIKENSFGSFPLKGVSHQN